MIRHPIINKEIQMKSVRFFQILIVIAILAVSGGVNPAYASGGSSFNFIAVLKGANEIPPVDTRATGVAQLKLNQDETELSYRLIVANIDNVTQAHIHCGASDVNGPVVVFLFGLGLAENPNGVLATGTITAGDVIPRPSSEVCPGGVANFDDLVEKMRTGQAYVNVHTWTSQPVRFAVRSGKIIVIPTQRLR
jgi:hypothetical protein